MNEERKQHLINDLKVNMTPNLFEVFDEKSFIKLVDTLSLSDEEAYHFCNSIGRASNFYKHIRFLDRNIYKSKQLQQIKVLKDNSKKLIEQMQKKIAILTENGEGDRKDREESKWLLLRALRTAGVIQDTGDQVVTIFGTNYEETYYTPEMYPSFDKKLFDFMERLVWFEQVSNRAFKKIESEVEDEKENTQNNPVSAITEGKIVTRKRPPNKHEWKFFISLCNTYYEFTGKIPEVSYSGGTVSQYNGDVLRFLENCYKGFGVKFVQSGAYNKLQDIKAGNQPKDLAWVKPEWPT